ncbi:hypothetical protein MXL79_23260 [Serratia ureilytica]|uniref:hypothetical protein n=1 Tax=Serratia ureilytica TaxID=300181 RepID=UPI002DB5B0FF|nr:hypothetical protein [Serratia ureilytica]MEB5996070.1 hypothetical protein [Serratia ureilytica]
MKSFFLAFALFFAGSAQAFQVSGVAFSDWYFPPASQYQYTLGFTVGGVVLEKADLPADHEGKVLCSGWGCSLEVRGYYDDNAYRIARTTLLPGTGQVERFSLEEFNELLRRKLPWTSQMGFWPIEARNKNFCIRLFLVAYKEYPLGASCEGTLPPIKPAPAVPIACQVKGLSRETIDFGTIIQGSEHRAEISASLGCEGDPSKTGQARLLFTDAERRGGDAAILRNARGEEIKARLSVGSEGGGNQSYLQVKAGYQTTYPLFVQLKAADFAGRSGYFSGTALLIFEVL